MILDDLERTAEVLNSNGKHTSNFLKRRSTGSIPAVECTYNLIGLRSSAVVIQRTCYEGDNQCVGVGSIQGQFGIFVAPLTIALLGRNKNRAVSGSVSFTLAVIALNEGVRAIQSYAFTCGSTTVLRMPCTVLGNFEVTVQVSYLKGKNTFHINELPSIVVVAPAIGCTGKIVVGCVDSHCCHQRHCKSK